MAQLQKRSIAKDQPFDVLLLLFQHQFLAVSTKSRLLGNTHAGAIVSIPNLTVTWAGTVIETVITFTLLWLQIALTTYHFTPDDNEPLA